MTRRRRCTCARESTRPSACEAATCAPTVREGGKIGRDEHPLDCSAEKHCGYLPPTRQPPSVPAKHNQHRSLPIRRKTFLQSNASKQPLVTIKTTQLVRTHLPLSNGHALSGAAARCLASSHGRLRRTTFFCVLRRGLPWLWHQVSVGHPQTPHPLDRARKVLTNCPHHGSSTQLRARWRLLFFKSLCFFLLWAMSLFLVFWHDSVCRRPETIISKGKHCFELVREGAGGNHSLIDLIQR